MDIPLEDISVGDELSRERVALVFDTEFGYAPKNRSIKPRRTDDDRQYVLLFGREDGHFYEPISEDRFEYTAEGRMGDDTTETPGNAGLANAMDGDVPVYFFYQPEDSRTWEYRGRVDVLDSEYRQKMTRKKLVFTMEYREPQASEEE